MQKPAVSLCADEWIATSIGTSGTIELAGVPLRVTGKSWYDDTFGHRATAPNDDGRELLFESDRVRGTTIGAARAFVIDKRGALSPDVSDVAPASDGKCLGTGFVELTGYATPVELATIVVRR